MREFEGVGRLLLSIGVVLAVVGALMVWGGQYFPLGRLPGDIIVRRGNFTLYFPVMTMLILSLLLTAILGVFRR
jgi:hypothetical protein